MIGEDYKAGNQYTFRAPLRDSAGALQSGKSATVAIYRPDGTPEPTPPTVSELGTSGVYSFTYTPASAGTYTFILSASGCLSTVWNIAVRTVQRSDLALAATALSNEVWTDAKAGYLDAAVSTRAPAATALSNLTWTDARAAKLDSLDATVSSRAPASTALSNTVWTDARAAKLDNLDATVGSRAAPGDAMTLTSAERTSIAQAVWAATTRTLTSFGTLVSDIWSATVRTITGGNVDTVANPVTAGTVQDKTGYSLTADYDAAKTAASSLYYTAARAAKLDNLDASVSSRAVPGDAMALTSAERAAVADAVLDEDVQSAAATASTLRAAAKAAWAQGFGKWVLAGNTLTLYGPDGTTVVRTFQLDDADNPTQRVPA